MTPKSTYDLRPCIYDRAGHLLGEYDGSGNLIQETVWLGDIPVATIQPSGSSVAIYYVKTDQLNTPRAIIRPSDNALMWTWFTGPFGIEAPNTNPQGAGTFIYDLRFPGQVAGAWGNTYQNYFRDYDPAVGRYVESDPLGLAGESYSTYAYAGGNPISSIDPTGTQAQAIAIPVAAAAAVAIACYATNTCQGISQALVKELTHESGDDVTAAKSVAEYCPNCQATATRSEAMAEAYAWAGIPPVGANPIPWSNFNPPGGSSFKNGPVWADFFRRYYPKNYGYSYNGGYVEEHPFGRPDKPGGSNHDCPHFVAVSSSGVEMEFPYQPGSP